MRDFTTETKRVQYADVEKRPNKEEIVYALKQLESVKRILQKLVQT